MGIKRSVASLLRRAAERLDPKSTVVIYMTPTNCAGENIEAAVKAALKRQGRTSLA